MINNNIEEIISFLVVAFLFSGLAWTIFFNKSKPEPLDYPPGEDAKGKYIRARFNSFIKYRIVNKGTKKKV